MAQSKLLGDVEIVADGQDAAGGEDAVLADNHSSVVERRVLEEDVLDEPLVDVRIDGLASADDIGQRGIALDDDECSHLALRHLHACHHDGHDVALELFPVFVLGVLGHEVLQEASHTLVFRVSSLLIESDLEKRWVKNL